MSRQISGKTFQAKTIPLLALFLLIGLEVCATQTPAPVTITMVAGAVGKEYELLAANPYLSELLDILAAVKPRSVHPQYADISNIVQQKIHQVPVGCLDAATATAAMATSIQTIISSSVREVTP